jgi:hypothetical protein
LTCKASTRKVPTDMKVVNTLCLRASDVACQGSPRLTFVAVSSPSHKRSGH